MPNDAGSFRYPHVMQAPGVPLGGASGAAHFHVHFVGKSNTDGFPYTVPNEKICSEIGRICGLHIPECVLYTVQKIPYVFSHFLEHADTRKSPPPSTAKEIFDFMESDGEYAHGIVCFDMLVCNNDRKIDNLMITSDKCFLIDHGNALFYRRDKKAEMGIARLRMVADDLSALFDRPHHFLSYLRSRKTVSEWVGRIEQIPDHFIEWVVKELPEGLLSQDEIDFIVPFLCKRKSALGEIIWTNRALFKELKN